MRPKIWCDEKSWKFLQNEVQLTSHWKENRRRLDAEDPSAFVLHGFRFYTLWAVSVLRSRLQLHWPDACGLLWSRCHSGTWCYHYVCFSLAGPLTLFKGRFRSQRLVRWVWVKISWVSLHIGVFFMTASFLAREERVYLNETLLARLPTLYKSWNQMCMKLVNETTRSG